MWLAIQERRREFGTLLAIGISRHRLVAMVVLETALLGLFAASAGAAAAWLVAGLGNAAAVRVAAPAFHDLVMTSTVQFSVALPHVLAIVTALWVVGVLAGLVPAWRAARLCPAFAMAQSD
jgi:putative ABC transport system permease protein